MVWNPDATNENCTNKYYGTEKIPTDTSDDGWFLNKNNNQTEIDKMLSASLKELTNEITDYDAWEKTFRYFNEKKHGEVEGYTQGEKIFIKINSTSTWGKGKSWGNISVDNEHMRNKSYGMSETFPHLILSLLRQLINIYGILQENIFVGDPMKMLYNNSYDLWKNEFPNVHYISNDGLIDNQVTSITSGNDGGIWFRTTGGISKFDGENWESFTEEDGLISENVIDIKSDSQNNIWVATDKGLSKLSKLPLSIFHNREIVNSYKILLKTFPNPFNLEVNFKLIVPFTTNISIQIFNSIGELIKEIDNKFFLSGTHSISWNAYDSNNRIVNSGIYFVRLQTSNTILTKKNILLK